MRDAVRHMQTADGFLGISLQRPIAAGDPYLLTVDWASAAHHAEGFRGSPAYAEWKRLTHRFYDTLPVVSYYEESFL